MTRRPVSSRAVASAAIAVLQSCRHSSDDRRRQVEHCTWGELHAPFVRLNEHIPRTICSSGRERALTHEHNEQSGISDAAPAPPQEKKPKRFALPVVFALPMLRQNDYYTDSCSLVNYFYSDMLLQRCLPRAAGSNIPTHSSAKLQNAARAWTPIIQKRRAKHTTRPPTRTRPHSPH